MRNGARFSLILAVFLTLVFCQIQPAMAQTGKKPKPKNNDFPFLVGWQWQYEYVSEEQDQNGAETIKSGDSEVRINRIKTTIKMEITSVYEDDQAIVAIVSGHGLELCQSPDKTDDYCLAFVKKNGWFWTGNKSLKNDFLAGKLSLPPTDPLLVLPPIIGQHWGGYNEIKRDDTWYRWQVEAKETITVPAGTFECFRLAYRTCPDHQLIWFCPGVGIVKQEYRHHGTITNLYLKLLTYGIKK